MPNFPGEHEVRIFYETPIGGLTLEHRHTFDVLSDDGYPPGTDMTDIDITLRNGTTAILAEYITSYVFSFLPLLDTPTTVNRAELWRYPPDGYDATFISAMTIGEAGTSTGSLIPNHYSMATFRTAGGSVLKLVLLEDVIIGDDQDNYPVDLGLVDDWFDFVMAIDSGIVGQDNTFPIAPLRLSKGQNEAVWRRRNRPR